MVGAVVFAGFIFLVELQAVTKKAAHRTVNMDAFEKSEYIVFLIALKVEFIKIV